MTPALRQALVVGAFATLCAVSATLAINAFARSPVVLATPDRHHDHRDDLQPWHHHQRRRDRQQAARHRLPERRRRCAGVHGGSRTEEPGQPGREAHRQDQESRRARPGHQQLRLLDQSALRQRWHDQRLPGERAAPDEVAQRGQRRHGARRTRPGGWRHANRRQLWPQRSQGGPGRGADPGDR